MVCKLKPAACSSVASEVSDEASGAHGKVHVVLPRPSRVYSPDAAMMQLSAGVQPGHVARAGLL